MTNKPTVCVVGTSSSQGKFTLQLKIREKLLGIGYKVGQIFFLLLINSYGT